MSANGEKLAAYLADELPADERAALEARLARDAALRRQLEAIRRSDAALAALPPVEPPADFSRRLRATLREELARTDGAADELAARRQQRRTRFLRGAGLAAAAAGVIGVASFGVASLLSGDDADTALTELSGPADDALALVQVSDTDYRADTLESLTDGAVVDPDRLDDLSQDEARDLAQRNTQELGYTSDVATALQAPGADDFGASADATLESDAAPSAELGAGTESADGAEAARVTDDPVEDARRCAAEILLESTDTLIPLLAEVATFEGEPAVLYLFASPSPDDGSFTRLEVWAVARADCVVLHFTQWQL
ncbi:MAG: hypothetical protein KY469_09040 [Actinobacteria bacterium]|nr:hypothetical protein [Actinomycetota bacterium]